MMHRMDRIRKCASRIRMCDSQLVSCSPVPPVPNLFVLRMNQPFHFTGRVRSFRYAIAGVWTMLKSQHNAWIHAMATAGVCTAGLALRLSSAEWCWIVIAIVAVWTAEALNTAFEFLADAASPEYHPLVKQAKDVAAGAVLIAAIGSVAIGALALGPRIGELFG